MTPALFVELGFEAIRKAWGLVLFGQVIAGQGAPAPPQLQAWRPSHGLPGWLSQTQLQSSQTEHFIICLGPLSVFLKTIAGDQVSVGVASPSVASAPLQSGHPDPQTVSKPY